MEATQGTEPKSMEVVIDTLSKILQESKELSEGFYQVGSGLEQFSVGQDKKDSEEKPHLEGAVPRLMELLEGLNDVNLRNREILVHMNRLV